MRAWLAVLALAIQCLVIQPHVDVAYAPVTAETAHFAAEITQPSHNTQTVCVICQAMAAAGAFALSDSPTLTLIERNFIASAPIAHSAPVEPARSHNWQSRAPPQAV
ncbi:MAG: hypothetical protein JSS00_07280 [Proteobacteria bacterium]|nr:hypothetical protein [Pseudomonadota bacterium]